MEVSLERAKGIEPSYRAWEALVLPLNYARTMKRERHYKRCASTNKSRFRSLPIK